MTSPYLTTRELASRWGFKPATLVTWRSRRTGPAYVRIGGSIRYRLADVNEYEQRGALARGAS